MASFTLFAMAKPKTHTHTMWKQQQERANNINTTLWAAVFYTCCLCESSPKRFILRSIFYDTHIHTSDYSICLNENHELPHETNTCISILSETFFWLTFQCVFCFFFFAFFVNLILLSNFRTKSKVGNSR